MAEQRELAANSLPKRRSRQPHLVVMGRQQPKCFFLSHWVAKDQRLPMHLLLMQFLVIRHLQQGQLDSSEADAAAITGVKIANWTGSGSARWQLWGFGEVVDYL